MRHRESWAVEKRAPTVAEAAREDPESRSSSGDRASTAAPRRVVMSPLAVEPESSVGAEVLIVVSKLKKYIRSQSTMNTSDNVIDVLSDELRRICDRAIQIARDDQRKTVLDRDVRAALMRQ